MDLGTAIASQLVAATVSQLTNSVNSNRMNFVANAMGWLVLRLHLLICV